MAKDAPIQFKGTSLKIIQTLLRSTDPQVVHEALAALTGNAADFFEDELTVLDFSGLNDVPDAIDWPALLALLQGSGLHPVATLGLPAELAAAAPLPQLADDALPRPKKAPPPVESTAPPLSPEAPALAGVAELAEVAEVVEVVVSAAPAAPDDAAVPVPAPATERADLGETPVPTAAFAEASPAAPSEPPAAIMPPMRRGEVLDRPLRSGQRHYARGCDLVVLAMVSAGAEVIADGNIHIYAPLRGRALAGASGDRGARILTTCMQAELVSVAGFYRTFENGMPPGLAGRPAQISLSDEGEQSSLRLEPLSLT